MTSRLIVGFLVAGCCVVTGAARLYTVGANAVFRVQLIAQGVQGRAK